MHPTKHRVPVGHSHMIKARLIRDTGKRCLGCGYQVQHCFHPHQLARAQGFFLARPQGADPAGRYECAGQPAIALLAVPRRQEHREQDRQRVAHLGNAAGLDAKTQAHGIPSIARLS